MNPDGSGLTKINKNEKEIIITHLGHLMGTK